MQFEFEFEADFGQVAFWHDDHDDMTFIRGDYCGVMLGMLQWSLGDPYDVTLLRCVCWDLMNFEFMITYIFLYP